jgi:hypothetical protein
MQKNHFVFTLLVIFLLSSVAFAEEGLDVRTSLKVNRAKRHQSIEDKGEELVSFGKKKETEKDPCAGVDIGNVYTNGQNRGAAPRENTVVVTGDVINIPSNKCR